MCHVVLHPFLHVLSSQYSASTSGMQLKILVFLIKMFLHVPGGEDVVKKQFFLYLSQQLGIFVALTSGMKEHYCQSSREREDLRVQVSISR